MSKGFVCGLDVVSTLSSLHGNNVIEIRLGAGGWYDLPHVAMEGVNRKAKPLRDLL